jgi:hypothetical protein
MRGQYVAPALGRLTVAELGPAWLARQQGHMKPSGLRVLRGCLACACRAALGHHAGV